MPQDYDQDVDTNGIPKTFNAEIERSRQDRISEVLVWDLCFRFLEGDQYLEWDKRMNRYVLAESKPGANRTITNKLLGIDKTYKSLLQSRYPKLTVKPTSPSYDNLTKSIATGQVIKYLWQFNNLPKVLRKNARFLSGCGTAAIHVYYDPGRDMVIMDPVSAYDLLFECGAEDIDEAGWIARRRIYAKEDLAETYPDDKKYILEEAPSIQRSDRRGEKIRKYASNKLETWEVCWRDGRTAVYLGDRCLFKSRLPKPVMPIIPYRHTVIPGRAYGLSLLYPIIDLQRQYNRYKNFGLDIADAVSHPKWLIADNAGVSKSSINNATEPMYYNGSAEKPQAVQLGTVPQHLFEIQNRTDGEMMDVGGMHSSTMGKRAPGVVSAVAMEELGSRDEAQLDDTMADIEDAVCEAFRVGLILWQAYMGEARTITLLDEASGAVTHKEIAASDFIDEPDVVITPGTLFSATSQDRDKWLMRLFEMKAIDGPTLLKELSQDVTDRDAMKKMVALSHAQDLLEALRQGLDIEIYPNDDLESLREVFEEFMATPSYYDPALAVRNAAEMGDPMALAEFDVQMGIQEKIRSVLIAVSTPMSATPQDIDALAQAQVYPRVQPPLPPAPPAMPGMGAKPGPKAPGEMPPEMMAGSNEALRGSPGISGTPG
jgi:hypothetical protein